MPDDLVPGQADIRPAETPTPPAADAATRPDKPINRAREALAAARARARAQGLQPDPGLAPDPVLVLPVPQTAIWRTAGSLAASFLA